MPARKRSKGIPRATGKMTRNPPSFDILGRSHPADVSELKTRIRGRFEEHHGGELSELRDWSKRHKIFLAKPPGMKKPIRLRITTKIPFPKERRRIRREISGNLGREGEIEGTAKELFYNLGVGARGLGTRKEMRKQAAWESRRAKLLKQLTAGEITKKDYLRVKRSYLGNRTS